MISNLSCLLLPSICALSLSTQLKHNPSSVLNGGGDRRVTELNKTFLQNTIRSVESHNRREVSLAMFRDQVATE